MCNQYYNLIVHREICSSQAKHSLTLWIDPYFRVLANAYTAVIRKMKREFFGLSDYYWLVTAYPMQHSGYMLACYVYTVVCVTV